MSDYNDKGITEAGYEKVNAKSQEQRITEAQNRAMIDQFNSMAETAPIYATLFSASGQNNDMVRLSFGDQLHPAIRPRFYGAFVSPIEAIRGLNGLLTKFLAQYDEAKAAQEAAKD